MFTLAIQGNDTHLSKKPFGKFPSRLQAYEYLENNEWVQGRGSLDHWRKSLNDNDTTFVKVEEFHEPLPLEQFPQAK